MTDNTLIIEWAPFETRPEFTERQIINLAEKVESEFLAKQPGYLRRELLKGDGNQWADLVYWENRESAMAGAKAANDSSVFFEYFSTMVGVDLESAEADVRVSGSGPVTIRVSDRLDVAISGSGSVRYIGDPTVNTSVTGSGSVEQIDD